MKRIFTLILVTVMGLSAYGQATIWSESFDSTATATYVVTLGVEGSAPVSSFGTISDYFLRVSNPAYLYTGAGEYYSTTGDFFAAQDLDGYNGSFPGGANPSQLTWSGIPITGFTSMTFEGLFASSNSKIDNTDSLVVEYRIDAGPWTTVIAFRNDGTGSNKDFLEDTNLDGIGDGTDLDSNFTSFSKNIFGSGSTLDLRVTVAVDAGGEDIAFDEFKIEGLISLNYHPSINSFTPSNGATDVSVTTDLTMTLDTPTVAGTGMIHLVNNSGGADINVAANSSDVSFSANMVTVTNLNLDFETDYTVLVDSDAFVLSTGEVSSGIYDSTRWNFTTAAASDTLNTLMTTFEDCNLITGSAAEFKIINLEGSKAWRCSIYGRSDSNAVYMNGYANGGPQTNLDYLVSPAIEGSINTSYMHFWQKRRFSGDNTIEVVYSTDYDGAGMPQNFTWTPVYTDNGTIDTNWSLRYNLDLTSLNGSVFYVAFRYTSDSVSNSGAFEWTIDDIMMTRDMYTAVEDINGKNLDAQLIGNPVTDGSIDMDITLESRGAIEMTLSSIMGQVIKTTSIQAPSGTSHQVLDIDDVASGLYILQLRGDDASATFKVMID